MNRWYVITGGPSTGKSTLLAELEKMGHKIFPEAARVVIDDAVEKGIAVKELRKYEDKFQDIVLDKKIETEKNHKVDVLTFFDRGMHDTIAYLRLHGFEITEKVEDAVRNAQYAKVFVLDPLDEYTEDYARTESADDARKLNDLLAASYAQYGMEPVRVPVMPPEERAAFVLRHID